MKTSKTDNLKKKSVKSALLKKLLPEALVTKYKKVFMDNGFQETEVKAIIANIESWITYVDKRISTQKKYEGLPKVVLNMCPCKHNCQNGTILSVDICTGHTNHYKTWFPEITKEGTNVGVLMDAIFSSGFINDTSVKLKIKQIFYKFSTLEQKKILKAIPKLKAIVKK